VQQGNLVPDSGAILYQENFVLNNFMLVDSAPLCFYVEMNSPSGKRQSEYECLDTEDRMEAMRVFSAVPTTSHKLTGFSMALLSPDGQTFAFTTQNTADYTGTLYIYAKQADHTWVQKKAEGYYFGFKSASFGAGSAFSANSEKLMLKVSYSGTSNNNDVAAHVVVFKKTGDAWAEEDTIADGFIDSTLSVSENGETLMLCNKSSLSGAYKIYDYNSATSTWASTKEVSFFGESYATRLCLLNGAGDQAVILASPSNTHTKIYTLAKSGTWGPRALAYENTSAVDAAAFGDKALITSDHASLFAFFERRVEHYKFDSGTGHFTKAADFGAQTAEGGYIKGLTVTSSDSEFYALYGSDFSPKMIQHFKNQGDAWVAQPSFKFDQVSKTDYFGTQMSCDQECHHLLVSDFEMRRETQTLHGFDLPSRSAVTSEKKGWLNFF
jgi:hypothetical protein